jgi:hypothetical protein
MAEIKRATVFQSDGNLIAITRVQYNKRSNCYFVTGKFFRKLGLDFGEVLLVKGYSNNGWWKLEKVKNVSLFDKIDKPVRVLRISKFGPNYHKQGAMFIPKEIFKTPGTNAQVIFKVLKREPGTVYVKILAEKKPNSRCSKKQK